VVKPHLQKYIQQEMRFEVLLTRLLHSTEKLWITDATKSEFETIQLTYSVATKLVTQLQKFHKTLEENESWRNKYQASKVHANMQKTLNGYEKILHQFAGVKNNSSSNSKLEIFMI